MRWACLLLPQLAIDGVLRRHPNPDAPLVLISGPVQRRLLHAVNPAARTLGLRPGMLLAAAQALGGDFATIEHDPPDAERWRQFLAAWAYRFSSQVSTDLPHALVLEVGHSLQLFGPWPRLEAQMREELRGLGFRHHLVAAPNSSRRVLIERARRTGCRRQIPCSTRWDSCLRSAQDCRRTRPFARAWACKLRQVFALPRDALNRRFRARCSISSPAWRGRAAGWFQPPDVRRSHRTRTRSNQPALLNPLRRRPRIRGLPRRSTAARASAWC
jgi:protein ImuB